MQRKVARLISVIILILFAIAVSVYQAPSSIMAGGGQPPVTLSLLPSSTTVQPGGIFTVNVALDMQASSHAISTLTVKLLFDPAILQATTFSLNTSAFPQLTLLEELPPTPGVGTVGATIGTGSDSANAIQNSATIVTITFQAVGSSSSPSSINWDRYEALSVSSWDESSENVVGSANGTSVCVGTCASTNDAFAAALMLSVPGSASGSSQGASLESGEPQPCGQIGATVWYKVQPGATGTLTASTSGSNYDTVLALYSGSSLTTLTQLGCNDDTSTIDFTSIVSASVTAGQTYYIQIGGYQGASGNFIVQVTLDSSLPPVVDLEVTTIQASSSPVCASSSVDFTASIRNNGSVESGSFDIKWDADGQIALGGHNSIPAGGTDGHGHIWDNIPLGQHTLTFIADDDNSIPEPDENNNTYTLSFTAIDCFNPNLLVNPSFELDANTDGKPDVWTANNKFTGSNEIPAHDGSYVGRFFATDNSGVNTQQTINNLAAGTNYSFSCWTNIPTTSDAFTFKYQIQWKNASNGTISTWTVKTYSDDTAGTWNEAAGTKVAPAGTVAAIVKLVASSLNGKIYIDACSLTGGSPPSDTTPPTVTGKTPAPGATNIIVGANVTATFSEAMNATTITGSSFTLTPQGGAAVAASVSYDANSKTATLDPNAALTSNTIYTASLNGTITDLAGNRLQSAPLSWSFTTASGGGGSRIKDITFEGGSLTGGTAGADTVNGTVTLASPGLKEAYAASMNAANSYLTENFSAADELFVSFYVQLNGLPGSSARIAQVLNGSATIGNILLTTSGKLRLRNNSTTIGADSAPLSVGTIYRIGLYQKKGTGGNAVLEVYLAAGDTPFGSPFASSATQTFTSQATAFRFGATNANALNGRFDNIRLDTAAMP